MTTSNIRVGVLGCGHWGQNLVRNFNALGAVAAVADPTAAGRELAHRLAPEARIVADPQELFADPSLAGVVIATPAETHAALCTRALEAGKDVFCEKPLALRIEDAERLDRLSRELGRILMVGHILEYHPAIAKLHQLIDEGQLGKVRYAYSNRLNLGKVRREENILWSFAPHDIAVLLRLFGQMPYRVVAAGGTYIQPNIADVTVSQLLFEDGRAAHIFVSWLNPFKEQKLVVIGSKRMATFDDVGKQLVLHDQRVDVREGEPVPVKGEGTLIEYAADEPLRLECTSFLTAIETRKAPVTDGPSAVRVLRVLSALHRSLLTQGCPETIQGG